MLALHKAQAAISAAIRLGPGRVPPGLFTGPAERVVMGLKVHANTISHARLIALEDSFPKTRSAMGDARFNTLSRRFIDGGGGTDKALAMIGADFPVWLEAGRVAGWLVRLARFEWAWLCAYRAADAAALDLAALARLDQAALLNLQVSLHPAARLVRSHPRLPSNLGLPRGDWLLLTRPDQQVLVASGGVGLAALFATLIAPLTIAALLDQLGQEHPHEALLSLVTLAIGAGALSENS